MITTLEIGAIVVPTDSLLEFDQQYSEIRPVRLRRTADNTGLLRSSATGKLSTVITGRGWIPATGADFDRAATHVIRCAMPRTASSDTTTMTLPAERRSDADHEPEGFAVVGDALVATAITNLAAINAGSTDDATLTSVAGASGYRVHYYPEFIGAILRFESQGASSAQFEWTLEVQQT